MSVKLKFTGTPAYFSKQASNPDKLIFLLHRESKFLSPPNVNYANYTHIHLVEPNKNFQCEIIFPADSWITVITSDIVASWGGNNFLKCHKGKMILDHHSDPAST